MGSNPMPGASIGRQSRGEHHVRAEAKTGVVLPQAKGCQGLPEPPEARGEWQELSLEPPVGINPADTLIFDF